MTKREFINRLRWFAANEGRGLPDEYGHPDYAPSRGETILSGMFARWLEDSDATDNRRECSWTRDLDRYLIDAFADFVVDPKWAESRRAYERETMHPVPDLLDVYAGGLHRMLVVHSLSRLMPLLAGDGGWLRERLAVTFGAQMAVIDQAWRRFVRIAYRKLMPRINAERHPGNSGVFGSTTLLTFASAGRVMFTFQRGDRTMTYIADDGDPIGLRSGPNSPGAPYAECVAMIEDVIAHWDADKLQRSDTIGIG